MGVCALPPSCKIARLIRDVPTHQAQAEFLVDRGATLSHRLARLPSALSMNIMVSVRACQLLGDVAAWNYCGNFLTLCSCAPRLGITVCQAPVNELFDAPPASSAFRNSVANVADERFELTDRMHAFASLVNEIKGERIGAFRFLLA